MITLKFLLSLAVLCQSLLAQPIKNSNSNFVFISITDGFLCINSQYVENRYEATNTPHCSILCSFNQRCQAFTTADGWCQLFVFDKCSKNVRDCSCSRTGEVFIKQQSLCPSSYGDDKCGLKFKLTSNSFSWQEGKNRCESDGVMAMMAELMNSTELDLVNSLRTNYSPGRDIWVGAYQSPTGVEPEGGWYWVGCNGTIDSGLWGRNEPNNLGRENAGTWNTLNALNDLDELKQKQVLCSCFSPFN